MKIVISVILILGINISVQAQADFVGIWEAFTGEDAIQLDISKTEDGMTVKYIVQYEGYENDEYVSEKIISSNQSILTFTLDVDGDSFDCILTLSDNKKSITFNAKNEDGETQEIEMNKK